MQDLNITYFQTPLFWHEIDANLSNFEEKIWSIPGKTDVIILPEMFTTGFTMDAEKLAEPANSRTFRWLNHMSLQTGAMVIGSYIVKEQGKYYNRLYCATPDSDATQNVYNKRHLFRMGNEHEHYAAGNQKLIVEWKGWKIRPLICYDLRFPVWSRNRFKNDRFDYDLLVFIANWPSARVSAWDSLLKARAIENQSYCIGVNRIGDDGEGKAHNGHSAIYDPKGNAIHGPNDLDEMVNLSLSKSELQSYREKFPAQYDADEFELL